MFLHLSQLKEPLYLSVFANSLSHHLKMAALAQASASGLPMGYFPALPFLLPEASAMWTQSLKEEYDERALDEYTYR